ncbi:chemotaxis protein CheB [Flavitalea flava]
MLSPKKKDKVPSTFAQDFPVVGIGGSAGGLEAFKRFLKAIPEYTGMAYVLVQHLNPSHDSLLPDILSRVTNIPVYEITDNINLAPDIIYIIPENKILTAVDGVLKLAPRNKTIANHAIDVFFISLAEVHRSFAVGVVLSGIGSDGTLGLKAIKEHGGITYVQDQESAAYGDMPQSAINAGLVDFVLPPEKITEHLLQIKNNFRITDTQVHEENVNKDEEFIFRQILSLLRQRNGVDFSYYKQPTIRRRIARRIGLRKSENLSSYLKLLKSDLSEQDALFKDVLIPVTSFFRDPKTFKIICESVLPELFRNTFSTEPIRIWVAGCSTGEEAYSIAICLHEYLGDRFSGNQIQIFATDISENAIAKARAGIYTKGDVLSLSEARLLKYFTKTNGSYQINKVIRDKCVFAVQNFLKDPPFPRLDLISCRNVLIYMDSFLQKKALTTFHYALKENRFLLLGKSETIGVVSEIYSPIFKHEKIYSRKSVAGRHMFSEGENEKMAVAGKIKSTSKPEILISDFRKNAESVLLSKYTPAGVIVNEQMDIVHIHRTVAPFLEPSPGKPTFNLLKMAHEGLGFELRNALHKAKEGNVTVIKEGIPIKSNGKPTSVTIEIIPLRNIPEPHFLILFREFILPNVEDVIEPEGDESPAQLKLKEALQRIQDLEMEMAQTREDMRSITEEQEANNEELQSANEELLSSGEELQSLNEEMETSKEELQSTNEELIIVNQELLDKQDQLYAERLYSESIVATIRGPLLVLDKALRIKSANPAFYKQFNISERETEGKLLYELQNHQWDDNVLRALLEKVLPQRTHLNDFEIILPFYPQGERTMLLNARQILNERNKAPLILLAIEDITERKTAEKKLELAFEEVKEKNIKINKQTEDSAKHFRFIAEAMPQKVWTADENGNMDYFNNQWLEYTHWSFEELRGWGWKGIIHPEDWEANLKIWQHSINTGDDFQLEHRLLRHDGVYRWHLSRGLPQRDGNGKLMMWIGTNTDINEQKVKEQTKDEFISIASHEMKTPLSIAKAYLQLLERCLDKNDTDSNIYTKKASESVNRLNNLINELLDVSKIQYGKLNYNITTFNFNDLLDSTIENMQYSSPQHPIIKTGQVKQEVKGDRDRLGQVVINLVSNAIKYSPLGEKVFIHVMENKDEILVSIKDSGVGISKQNIGKIFDKYYRVENHANQSQGLGIGLFISFEIIQRHHGKIWVESDLGKGSIFYFSLPV